MTGNLQEDPKIRRAKFLRGRERDPERLDTAYYRVARVLDDPSNRDLTTAAFIQAYLKMFPGEKGKGAVEECVRRFRADLQNVVAPDMYPHSPDWRHHSAKQQAKSKAFYGPEKAKAAKRESILPKNPFPDLLRFEDGAFRPTRYLDSEEFTKVHAALKSRGFRYVAGSRIWKP